MINLTLWTISKERIHNREFTVESLSSRPRRTIHLLRFPITRRHVVDLVPDIVETVIVPKSFPLTFAFSSVQLSIFMSARLDA